MVCIQCTVTVRVKEKAVPDFSICISMIGMKDDIHGDSLGSC